MSALADIISTLETATGSSPDLDLRIAYHLGWRQPTEGHIHIPGSDVRRQWWRKPDGRSHYGLPRWTESVDDALTLIPAHCGYAFGYATFLPAPQTLFYGMIIFRDTASSAKLNEIGTGQHAHSLALAICVATLQARDALARAS